MSDDRQKLIRLQFEAMRDLAWVEALAPRFRDYGLDAEQMKKYREAWNQHTEARDWAWWQQNTTESNDQLRADIKEMTDRIAQSAAFNDMLADAARRSVPQNDNGHER